MTEWYEASSARQTARHRWDKGSAESRPSRNRELEDLARRPVPALGPYETTYDVSLGYGADREILTP
jgi:hypothetical protein